MGGYGSGKRWEAKPTTDHALRLDVRRLVREGVIQSGGLVSSSLHWTRNGQPNGSIEVHYDVRRPDELILTYRTRGPFDADWTEVREVIRLDWTPCHYGGERVWWRCPGCGRRKAVLYSVAGRFRCVACNGLAYGSTREDALYRAGRRGATILGKLGAKQEWVLTWLVPPPKPKGMHATTYRQLVGEWEAVQAAATDHYVAGVRQWHDRVDRMGKRRGRE